MSQGILGLVNPAIALTFAAVFVALWLRDRRSSHALGFGISYACMAAGFLVFHFTPAPDGLLSILIMHAIYCASSASLCWAAATRVGQRVPVVAFAVIMAVSSVLMIAASVGSDMNARLIAANSAYGLLIALTAQIIARSGRREWVERLVTWLFAITAGQFFVRPLVAILVSGPMSAEIYRASDFYSVLILTMAIAALLLALSLVAAILSEQLGAERARSELDHLTGLRMRRAFEQTAMGVIEENLDRRVPLTMIVADIDHFKQVNDAWGHQAGDTAIAAFGSLIGGTLRDTDVCGRVGGEEFCILAWNCDLPAARRLADRIRRNFADTLHPEIGDDVKLSASFGVAQWRPGEGYGKLFARADQALYDAKHKGRNRVETEGAAQAADAVVDVRNGLSEVA